MRLLTSSILLATSLSFLASHTVAAVAADQDAQTHDKISPIVTGIRFKSDRYLPNGTPAFTRFPKELEVAYSGIGSDLKDILVIVSLVRGGGNGNFIRSGDESRTVFRSFRCLFEDVERTQDGQFQDTRVCKVAEPDGVMGASINTTPMLEGLYAIYAVSSTDTLDNKLLQGVNIIAKIEVPGQQYQDELWKPEDISD